MEEPQTVEHWVHRSPNLDVHLYDAFGSPSPPLGVLTIGSDKVLALDRTTL